MAQEVSGSGSLSINSNGGQGAGAFNFVADISADGFIAEEISVATSASAVPVGDITPQSVFIKNLDDTNFIEVDSANTFDKFPQKIYPGKGVFLAPETATIYWKANTGAVNALLVVA
jgi:hypothetical protein